MRSHLACAYKVVFKRSVLKDSLEKEEKQKTENYEKEG